MWKSPAAVAVPEDDALEASEEVDGAMSAVPEESRVELLELAGVDALAEVDESPVTPPVAPVVAIRDWASAAVSQVILVPALFTSGNAKH